MFSKHIHHLLFLVALVACAAAMPVGDIVMAYISPSQVFGGASASQSSQTPLPFGESNFGVPLPFGGATSEPPLPFGSSASIPMPFEGSSSSASSVASSASSSSSTTSSSSSTSSASSSSGGSSGGTSGGGGSGGTGGGSTGGGGGGTGGGYSGFTPPTYQNGPDYIRTFYQPEQVQAAESGGGDVLGAVGGPGGDALIDGVHGGADLTPKPALSQVTKPTSSVKTPAKVPRVPRTADSGPTEMLAALSLMIAAACTFAISFRRSSHSLFLPQ